MIGITKKTPLYDEHVKLKATIVDFSGWMMPVQYTNVIDEHNCTRQKAGLFDICHMGQITVMGKDAAKFLQFVMTNDIYKLEDGKAQYACICNENGGVVDDCFIYQFNEEFYMVVVNAGTIEKDFEWFKRHSEGFEIQLDDRSDATAKLDLQGPKAEQILQTLTDFNLKELERFYFVSDNVCGNNCVISRTGYTGEDGFELYFSSDDACEMWNKLLEAGKEFGLQAIGLGARDTLRLEACYSLYGHELNDNITPVEAGIGWVVRKKEEDFIGKDILLKQKSEGTEIINVALEMEKGIAREHYSIIKNDQEIGHVSSGTFSPSLKKAIALGFVKKKFSTEGETIKIKIRDKLYDAKVVKKPFYAYRGGE